MRTSSRAFDPDRVPRVVERAPVDRVEVVLAVAVGVEAVHHHDELLRRRARLLRVDDERAVEALVDVLLQRRGVTVVEMEPGGAGLELVRELDPRTRRSRRPRPCSTGGFRGSGSCAGASPRSGIARGACHPRSRGSPGRGPCRCTIQRGEEDARGDLELESVAVSVYSRTRPGSYGSARRGIEERVEVAGPPTAGTSSPTIAACPVAAVRCGGRRARVHGSSGRAGQPRLAHRARACPRSGLPRAARRLPGACHG